MLAVANHYKLLYSCQNVNVLHFHHAYRRKLSDVFIKYGVDLYSCCISAEQVKSIKGQNKLLNTGLQKQRT